MRNRSRSQTWKRAVAMLFGVGVFMYALWSAGGFVMAYRTIKTVHVFPTSVSATGWDNSQQALTQELSADASFATFSSANSASIALGEVPQPSPVMTGGGGAPTPAAPFVSPDESLRGETSETDAGDDVSEETETSETDTGASSGNEGDVTPEAATNTADNGEVSAEPTSSSESTNDTAPSDNAPAESDANSEEAAPVQEPAAEQAAPAPAESSAVESVPASTPEPAPVPAPVEAPASEPTSLRTPGSLFHTALRKAGSFAFSALVTTVFATTTQFDESASSTSADAATSTDVSEATPETTTNFDDVATCTILGRECHTLELSGFRVEGGITEKKFQKALLSFSFANLAPEDLQADDKLSVRYFFDGRWRHAGEIYLNKEISNATNGGYFVQELDEVMSWDDVANVTVVFEFERNGTAPVQLFLDSAWIDVEYTDRAQEVLDGEPAQPDVSKNITFDLADGGAVNPARLALSRDDVIALDYISTLDSSLVVRADKPVYFADGAIRETAYVSVTNIGTRADSFRLVAGFPEGAGALVEAYQFMRNVPSPSEKPVVSDVTYFCGSGWMTATSSDEYRCVDTGDVQACAWLNESGENCLVESVEVGMESYTAYADGWVTVATTSAGRLANLKGLFDTRYAAVGALDGDTELQPGQTIYFKLVLESAGDEPSFVLKADGTLYNGVLESAAIREETHLLAEREEQTPKKRVNDLVSARASFSGDEFPEFAFKYKSQRNVLVRSVRRLFNVQIRPTVNEVVLVHRSGKHFFMPADISYDENGEWRVSFKERPDPFMPGEYTLLVQIEEDGAVYEDAQTFSWGVLALNTVQSVYAPGEDVVVHMAALSPNGNTICDANLELRIIDPSENENIVPVSPSGECYGNNVTDVPDYTARYTAGETGTYTAVLSRLNADGEVAASITETLEVRDRASIPLIVERIGPTRIYPVASYEMEIHVTAREAFTGTVQEVVSNEMEILGSDPQQSGATLSWQLDLEPGETSVLRYTFDAADKSPYLYTAGPMTFTDDAGTLRFTEARAWQIASDATGNMLLLWDSGASVPSGWSCVSCVSGDPFYQRFIMGSTTYGGTGGASTHTHTATGAVTAGGSGVGEQRSGTGFSGTGHTHTYLPTIETISNLPPYRQLRVIQSVSAGEPASIPTGAIAIFDTTVPSGWTRYSSQDTYFVRGETTVGSTGGNSSHTHSITGNTSAASGDTQGPRGGAISIAQSTHTHSVTSTTDSQSLLPPYLNVVLGKLDSASAPPNDMIAMWTEDAPAGWNVVSGAGSDFNGRFIRGSATYGTTGGAASHAHGNVTGITSGAAVGTGTGRSGSPNAAVDGAHAHAVDVTNFSTASNLPPYIEVPFAKRLANVPVYTQHSFRWYANANAEPPTDPWPAGATDLAENAEIPDAHDVEYGDVLRLRMAVGVTNSTSTTAGDTFKLQYAVGPACSEAVSWQDVGDTASTTALWRGYNNTGVSDGAALSSTTLAISNVAATYEEENNSATLPGDIGPGQYGEWDWVIQHNGAVGDEQYCFRMVRSDGSALNAYTEYPKVMTNSSPETVTLDEPFSNEKIGTTTPALQFSADDPEIDSLNYQIQVSTDAAFGSTALDVNSVSSPTVFENLLTPADKAPFNSGDTIRYQVTSALSNNTTYWWRVRAQDPSGSGNWGEWSNAASFTTDTSVTIATWHQTTDEQFETDTRSGVQSSGSDTVTLISGSTTGSLYSDAILFEWGESETSNAWGQLSWNDVETTGDIQYVVEYYDDAEAVWAEVPDGDLSGNSSGFDTSPVSLLALSPVTYPQLRIRADFTNSGGSPSLQDWTVTWGTRVAQPTLYSLFDNEKTGTTTPTFEFLSSDPQSDDLTYEIQWSTDATFGTGTTTRSSDTHAGFSSVTAPGDTDPFTSGHRIRFTVQAANALSNNTTYWWRVRAKDPTGGNAFSEWSESRSFTVDTSVTTSTWFQTTNAQFDSDTLLGTYAVSNSLQVATSVQDVLVAYGEGTTQTPRYRLWNGSSWSSEGSAQSVGSTINWVVTRAHPQANEYALATMGANGNVYAQIYTGGEWDNLQLLTTTVGSLNARGFDLVYESQSGDLLAVYCDGDSNPSYRVFTGTSWSSASSIVLASASNCEWIRLAADPTSDEIILVSLPTGGGQYEAQVWNGSSWGNSVTWGSMSESNEGIAIAYEESGGQAVVTVSNGNSPNMSWRAWDGASWTGASNQNVGGMEWGVLRRDKGSDAMALCFVDDATQVESMRWSGSAWTGQAQLDAAANSKADRPVDCAYETTAGRDGNIMAVYSDATAARYRVWNGASWSAEASVSTISNSATVQVTRADNGAILAMFFDHGNDRYDFSYWNGSSWSTAQTLESNASVSSLPYKEPFMMAPRNSASAGSITSSAIAFSEGNGPKWDSVSWNHSAPGGSSILYQVEYLTASSTWELIPDGEIPNNSTGTSTGPISLDTLDTSTYGTIRLVASLTCNGSSCPTLNDWQVTWAAGLSVSGTAKQYDQSTNVTSGTLAVAVNGSMQLGKTGTISNGSWSINNVTVFPGDVVTVFVDGAAPANRAVAVAKYDGSGDITGIELFERHLSIGSADDQTITNADLGSYDNSVSGDGDVFHDVDAGNDLTACVVSGCGDVRLYVQSGEMYRPDSASSGNVSAHDVQIDGTFTADGNTITVSGSWDNNATFNADASSVIFTATSTTESVDSTGASTASFNNITFGQTSGSAVWNFATPLDVNGNLSVNFGTTSPGTSAVTVAGNVSFGASGSWEKGSSALTFDGTGTANWTDNTALKQDLGTVVVDGSSKTVTLGSSVRVTDITIGADDTLNAGGTNTIEVLGNWTNNNSFVAQTGTVVFAATDTGNTIAVGNSSFYNLTFNGSAGNWSFTETLLTTSNNFTVSAGTVTMPSGTTTIAGNLDASGGAFMHNNGVVLLTASAAKTLRPGGSSFYDLVFNGTGSWSFVDANATSSRHVTISAGTVTAPSGNFAIGGSFAKNGGTFTHNSGTLKFTASNARSIRLNNADAHNLTFAGSGSWSFVDTSATTTNTVRVENGALTLPAGAFAIGGSLENTGGSFAHNNGTVIFNATTTGKTIAPNGSWFYNTIFNGSAGGWTITESATSSNNVTLANASSFQMANGETLAVGGVFTNAVASSSTTWTGSSLYLYSGTPYSINTKSSGDDTYGTLIVGANTDLEMWNSSAASTDVEATGSLYSQDHAGVDGDLYIWGSYASDENEYWSYTTDFDGTDLTGSERQANVRFAPGASFSFSSSTLQILGTPSATTTIAHQGFGSYSFDVTGGTLNAQYYQFRNLDADGLSISGTPTITSLSDGDFELAVTSGGTMMTVSGTAIDQNPILQIQRVRFATSTGVTDGYNVTVTGAPSSYWWFREHSGNYDGEAFDNDPDGNPGNVRWDDSALDITVSGTVYADHGVTPIGNPTCDGSTNVVRVVINGGASFAGSCDSSTGEYSVANVQFTGDVVMAVYLDTNGGSRAATVTKTPTGNLADVDLYEDALIVRHEDVVPITIADLAVYDSADDSDIPFAASTSSTDTLTVAPETELYIWSGKEFAPGGNISLQSGGSGDARDGRFYAATSSRFTAAGTESHSVGGGMIMAASSTLTAANSTFTFTATTSGKVLSASDPITLHNLTFNGSGGGWLLTSTATTTVENNLHITAGSFTGTGDVVVESGDLTGDGSIAMTGGTFVLEGTGNLGSDTAWQFHNLTLGGGSAGTTTKTGAATTTVSRTLRVSSGQILKAGSAPWVLSGSGTPFVVNGTFDVETAPWWYTGTTTTNVADETYADVFFAPAAGTPTYAIMGGIFTADAVSIGGVNPVLVNVDTNDPAVVVNGDLTIGSGSTLIASGIGAFEVGGSWDNDGTFTASGGTVEFNSTDTGETIAAGTSPFASLIFDNAGGGWTLTGNATTTGSFSLTNASSFTLVPSAVLSVGGAFTNGVGGANTTWTDSTLALVSGTSYSGNTKSAGGDVYGTLLIGANTDVRLWNSSAATTSVHASGSLYSQDHAGTDGDLYIWGSYEHSAGSDYWSYATDFDGTDLTGSERAVSVNIASSSSVTSSGGVLDVIGAPGATTTIGVQGGGTYALTVSGGTLNAQYYQFRGLNSTGLNLSGTPTISSLSNGDFELEINGGTAMTVAGTVIDANPLKIIQRNRFATSSGVSVGSNVEATGSPISSWKFNLHYGGLDGEAYDEDPAGDPGHLRWDNSAADISISGRVYSDEGTTVSSVCDGTTPVVRLKLQGAGEFTSACNGTTGVYSISDISYNPGDVVTVYLDTNGGARAVNVSVDPVTTIADMHLYENRVIVRHEDSAPITIADMAIFENDDDADVFFDAVDAATDTLTLPPETKLIVWDTKTFAPAGNVTLQSGGSGDSWDGTLEVRDNGFFIAAGSQSHSIGGSFILGTDAGFTPANSTITFTATTTGKTIAPQTSGFHNIVFNGSGGNWAFSGGSASTTNDFTISAGTVTLANGTTTIGGSFNNTGGTFMHNNGTLLFTATDSGNAVRASGSNFYSLYFNGAGGSWTMQDANATSSRDVTIAAGTLMLPSGTFAVGSSFSNEGGSFAHSSGTVKLTASASGKTVRAGGSNFHNLLFSGSGAWVFNDTNATTTGSITIVNGSTTLPGGALAVGGSFVNTGTFDHNNGTVKFNASGTGNSVTASSSPFYNIEFASASGGWTITGSATTSNDFTLASASSFALSPGASLEVGGAFANAVGGANTTWDGSTVYLNSGSSFAVSGKSAGTESYNTLIIGAGTNVKMWNSSAGTTTVDATGSLYSQDHAGADGDLYIWGTYANTDGSEYWNYATDFDGAALGGSSRQVDVRIAPNASVTLTDTALAMVGAAGATTTIAAQGSGTYSFSLSDGSLNAQYYAIRNTDSDGLNISGEPTITSLDNGDFELSSEGGALITLAGTALDANAGFVVNDVRFATSSGMTSGYNVVLTGSPLSSWSFRDHYGNYDGEAFDSDGGDACGNIRWEDSACLFVNQAHYRWRNDNGGEGAPDSEWFNASWSKRKRISIANNTGTAYADIPVKVVLDYDADMQSDFSDLRFTDSSGTSSLPFWIESYTASASSTVWVQVGSLPAGDDAVIYAYYGNAGASSASDGESTFSFFDDFEDDDIAEYSGDTSLFNVGTDFNYSGTYGLDTAGNENQKTTNGIYRTGSLVSQGDTIRFFQYVDSTQDDEPCTLFGVQGSGQNYAVCLDQFPSDKVILAKNVTSNDGSGTVLASTTVSFSTGWYEVEIDWLTDDSINVTVYGASGSVFATVSASDGSYTSGGVGFSYWGQNGGWDLYSARPYTAAAPTFEFGSEQADGGATWRNAEDSAAVRVEVGENLRLRFSIQNTGAEITDQNFRIQYASKGSSLNCSSVPYVNYNDVPTAGSCGSSPVCMIDSTNVTDQTNTTPHLSYPATLGYTPGKFVDNTSNESNALTVPADTATEMEYALEMTGNATQNAYCFRVTDGGLDLDNYDRMAEAVMTHAPSISNFALNNALDIALTEGATTTVFATGTVTDLNGYQNIVYATSSIYRSGVGASCSPNTNSCYQVASSSCSFTGCSGNSCTLVCAADIYYLAEPTDVGSAYEEDDWVAAVYVADAEGESDSQISLGVDLLTLYGLDIQTPGIDFGALAVGSDTGSINASTTIVNTGNSEIDIEVAGTDLVGEDSAIAVGEQKFATTTFAYGACAICQFLAGSATSVDVDLPKPTSTSTQITDELYWGINIPSGTRAVTHEGVNTFMAVSSQ